MERNPSTRNSSSRPLHGEDTISFSPIDGRFKDSYDENDQLLGRLLFDPSFRRAAAMDPFYNRMVRVALRRVVLEQNAPFAQTIIDLINRYLP